MSLHAQVPATTPLRNASAPPCRSPLPPIQRSFVFGPFCLQPERQLLLGHGVRVKIGGRALDILAALVERPGDLLSKQELLSSGWPDRFVDESNLKVTIASLRKILDENPAAPRYIATVPGRGYRFVATVLANSEPFTELLD
jgi:DNA-binding winged helix-turn-helix (wHTH) protein